MTTIHTPALAPMLAKAWADQDPTGWHLSEKLDGVRALWDGATLCSRNGNAFALPDALRAQLPALPLDGELFMGRGQFQATVGRVRRQDGNPADWQGIVYRVFDTPSLDVPFETRLDTVRDALQGSAFAQAHEHGVCQSLEHLLAELARVQGLGGEGLMLRRPGSLYEPKRSSALLKVKTFEDSDAVVVGYTDGQGKHQGVIGALVCESQGKRFQIGTGLADADRELPPAVGALVTFRHQGLTDAGLPRFPVFAGVRAESRQ